MTPTTPVVHRHVAITAVAVLVSACVLAGSIVGALFAYRALTPPFDPIYFPGQHVATTSVHLGGGVQVKSTRCNRSKHPVTMNSTKEWVSIQPAGTIVQVGLTSVTVPPGCATLTALNPMPPDVVSHTSALLASGGLTSVTWKISVVDVPQGHRNAPTVGWSTTPIVVTK